MIEKVSARGVPYRQTVWQPLTAAIASNKSNKSAGVYLARYADTEIVFYVGYAGVRGVPARLTEYAGGNDLNGLGVAALNLALNDAEWIRQRLDDVESGKSADAVQWMRDALVRVPIEISILSAGGPPEAKKLEDEMIELYEPTLLNRAVVRKRSKRS